MRVVEDEPSRALRIGRREQERQTRAVLRAPQQRPLRPHRIHDQAQVVHPGLERRWLAESVGETCTALVEHEDTRYRRKALELADK